MFYVLILLFRKTKITMLYVALTFYKSSSFHAKSFVFSLYDKNYSDDVESCLLVYVTFI